MKRKNKALQKTVIIIVIATVMILLFATYKFSFYYIYYSFTIRDASIDDHAFFKSTAIDISDTPFSFGDDESYRTAFEESVLNIEYRHQGEVKQGTLTQLFSDTNTTAFLVVKDNNIYCEWYGDGYDRAFAGTSFSVSKSFISTLAGIAIDEGYFTLDDSISEYIPELKDENFEKITIRDLISMTSGIQFREDVPVFGHMEDDSLTYRYPDLRKLILDVNIAEPPQEHHIYNDYNPMLVSLIIERTTGKSVSEYMQEKLWNPMGAEYPASWTTDEHGFEKSAFGLNASPIDYAKFGCLFLNNGFFHGNQIVPSNWVREATEPDLSLKARSGYYPDWIQNSDLYYKYFWWGNAENCTDYNFFAWGYLGQYIYIIPDKNVVIVRQGSEYGLDDYHWPDVFKAIGDKSDEWGG